jgi:GntR family transcriptional regulator
MILDLTDITGEPLQSQIIRQLRAKILSGELPAGYLLPSIRSFARDQKVSVITVQRAYENLERLGLVVSHPGKGYFVREIDTDKKKSLASDALKEKLEPVLEAAINEGLPASDIKSIINEILHNNHNKD